MKDLRHVLLFEANKKKPSGLGKVKNNSTTQEVEFIAGDIYDLSDSNRYKDKFTYYKGDGTGYIMDKEGRYYDVYTNETQGDAGRIAGGSIRYWVKIAKANGQDDAIFTGYTAVFSRSHGNFIIADIKSGYYLEDYFAKNWEHLSSDKDKFEELRSKGNANAKSAAEEKEENDAKKRAEFNERYIMLIDKVFFDIENGEVKTGNLIKPEHRNRIEMPKNSRGDSALWEPDPEKRKEYDKLVNDYEKSIRDLQRQLTRCLLSTIEKLTKEYFKTDDLSDLNGLRFALVPNIRVYQEAIAIDTKKDKLVFFKVDREKYKITNDDVKFNLYNICELNKKNAAEYITDIFKRASQAWLKTNKRTKTEYINKSWYGHMEGSVTQAKKAAGAEFDRKVNAHDWDKSGNSIKFSTDFIKDFINGKIKDSEGTVISPDAKPVEASSSSSKAWKVQEPKMDAWHDGTRKQNVSSCSDAKLKLNYDICKAKGYNKEADILKKEADKRGLTLESMNIDNMNFSIIEKLYLA